MSTVILGWDFLTNHNASIQCLSGRAVLRLGGQELPLQDNQYFKSLVRLQQNVYIPPMSTSIGKARVRGQPLGISGSNPYVVSQIDHGFLSQEPGLMIMNGIVEVKGRLTFPIAVVNSTNRAFNLKKGNVVAKIRSLDDTTICSMAEACEQGEDSQGGADLSIPSEYRDRVE